MQLNFAMARLSAPAGLLDVFASAVAFLRIVSRYATCGRPTLACTLYSRSMRSTIISKCNSPMPEISVCPVSGSVERGTSDLLRQPLHRHAQFVLVGFRLWLDGHGITGVGKSIFSRMIGLVSSHSVSPVLTLFRPTQAQISPA